MKLPLVTLALCLALAGTLPAVVGQTPATQTNTSRPREKTPAELSEEGPTVGTVVIEGSTVLHTYAPIGAYAPEQRAQHIAQRIIYSARNRAISLDSLHLQERDAWTEIIMGPDLLMAVTESDASIAARPRAQIAAEDLEAIRRAIQTYRSEHSLRYILRGILYTVLVTAAAVALLFTLRRIRFTVRDWLEARLAASAQRERRSAWQITLLYAGSAALAIGSIFRWVVIIVLLQLYLTVTLRFFSATRSISYAATNWVFGQINDLARSAIDYLPNLLVIIVVALVTYYAIQLLHKIFGELSRGTIQVRGFYPDWAGPTEKLVRILLLALSLVVIFPYLPGAKSSAFQGVSIFLGVLLSLGSSSAVANAIAGVILTYMRSFLIGDWVKIGDVTGEIIEKNLLVTRVLTPKAEVITLPNANVMSGAVQNYTVMARGGGVIFHTTVSIGYDAPWRTVHQLLIDAATATKHVLVQPAPFVLQTALNDFYVCYQLNAYTDSPKFMLDIFSDLHKNIQDRFNEAGVEICSPHFNAVRDGNTIAIPRENIRPDYQTPSFRVKLDADKAS